MEKFPKVNPPTTEFRDSYIKITRMSNGLDEEELMNDYHIKAKPFVFKEIHKKNIENSFMTKTDSIYISIRTLEKNSGFKNVWKDVPKNIQVKLFEKIVREVVDELNLHILAVLEKNPPVYAIGQYKLRTKKKNTKIKKGI